MVILLGLLNYHVSISQINCSTSILEGVIRDLLRHSSHLLFGAGHTIQVLVIFNKTSVLVDIFRDLLKLRIVVILLLAS